MTGLSHSDNTFVIGASANIDTDATPDQWTVNELRQLVPVSDDVTL
jgi:hypothetical protein